MKKYLIMKYFFILFVGINAYITFPLLKDNPSFSKEDTPSDIINKLFYSNLYIKMNIGSENVEVKSYLSIDRHELMIAGIGVKNHKYNQNKSESYKCSYCKEKEFTYGDYNRGIISTENFKINFNGAELRTIKNMNFILGTSSIYMDPPEGSIGLNLPKIESETNYNLLKSLKLTNSTNSYIWYLNFTEKNSKMIIDAFPHDLDSITYNASNLKMVNSIKEGSSLIWGLKFEKIYYENENNNIGSSEAKIDFTINYIFAPNETGKFLENIFFEEYYKRNICFKKGINYNRQYFIYCLNSKDFDPKQFKNIYFQSSELDISFELNYNELFLYKDNYVYFLILFQNGNNFWRFGEIFLKKYYLVFDNDDKSLGFYKTIEKNEDNNTKTDYIQYILIGLLVLIFAGVVAILIVVFLKKSKKKKRANELDDNFEYQAKIDEAYDSDKKKDNNSPNDNEEKNEIIPPD